MLLQHQYITDAGGFNADQFNISPDSGVWESRSPIPAEHTVRFSQQREAQHGIRGAVSRVFRISLPDIAGRRSEADSDLILSFMQKGLCVILPDPVHVVRMADGRTVEEDLCQRVQPFTAQQHGVAGEQRGRRVETACIEEIVLHQLQGFRLIVTVEGIGNQLCAEQIMIDRSRYLCRNAAVSGIRNVKRPCAVE